ncbi:hypothetical protein ABZ027_43000 [Streptomyces sp. NPDC006332]|uniref:hypothetical protein n=1 Tax=Streptomyces sp. NPDC006332 TaxID=3155456 RepID=UPI0033BE950A
MRQFAGEPAPGTGAERDGGMLLMGALVGSALSPFVQALATRLGDDVYAKIQEVFARRRSDGAAASDEPDAPRGRTVALADPEQAIAIRLPWRLTPEQARELAWVRLPRSVPGQWLIVQRTDDGTEWQIVAGARPPDDALDVRSDDQI